MNNMGKTYFDIAVVLVSGFLQGPESSSESAVIAACVSSPSLSHISRTTLQMRLMAGPVRPACARCSLMVVITLVS